MYCSISCSLVISRVILPSPAVVRDGSGHDRLCDGVRCAVVLVVPGSNNTALGVLKLQPITSPVSAGIGSLSPDSRRPGREAATAELGQELP
jgi:hypothetical protein